MEGSQWIIQIQNRLNDTSNEDELHISPSITCVPKPLLSTKPEAYIPQLITLGPYHHNKEELHHIERFKICAVKKLKSQSVNFESILDAFLKFEYRIRAHYQRYLPFDGETLAWMMAIDASFLIDFMHSFTKNDNSNLARVPSENVKFIDPTRRTSTQDMLIRDVVMLEDQIPIFLLLKILEIKLKLPQIIVEETLAEMVIALLKELTPFKMATKFESVQISRHSHLLELLYHSIVPLYDDDDEEPQEIIDDVNHESYLNKCRSLFHICKGFVLARGRAFMSLLLTFCMKIPTFSFIKLAIENTCVVKTDANINQECRHNPNQGISSEEISIPSVTELANAGVQFKPTHGDISSIAFDAKTGTLYLPEISLNVNSDTVLRNIVAYEAAVVTGPLTFTRYIELMNGIIDTEEDARILREKEVLVNGLRNDKEVAEMWNGMSRSIRLTKVRVLDEMIEEINRYYNGKWKVKTGRFLRKYILRSWECIVAITVIVVLVIVGIHVLSAGYGLLRSWTYKGAYRGRGR